MPEQKTILFDERLDKKDPKDFGWITMYDSRQNNPKLENTNLLEEKSAIQNFRLEISENL